MEENTENLDTVNNVSIENAEVTKPIVEKTSDGYKVDFLKKQTTTNEEEQSLQHSNKEQQVQTSQGEDDGAEEKVLEEITVNDTVVDSVVDTVTKQDVVAESKQSNIELPDNIQKVVDFMNETGGTLEDYVRLNADYSNVDEQTLLREYYKQTKSNLTSEEIDFLIEDNFTYDEELDDDREVRRRKLAYKEAISEAKKFLGDLKSKYYDEVKLSSKLTPEQREAVEFYNQYKEQVKSGEELSSRQKEHFNKVTSELFNDQFKGFEFKVGEKNYRFNVKDVKATMDKQSDVLNVFKPYIKDNVLSDAKGYHKALFAASNPDALANHFYEQGRADALREATANAKNINIDGRKSDPGVINANGVKVKVIDGDNSSKLKIKLKNY